MIDTLLGKHFYLCGDKCSLGDILVYNELTLFLAVTDMKWTRPAGEEGQDVSEFEHLCKWGSSRMQALYPLKGIDEQMKVALRKLNNQ